ncbi:MAG: type II secretion system protein [Desulfobacterium sp.]
MNRRGFTLIELLTVMAIIGILATIATPSFQKSVIRAREVSLRRSLFVMRDVIDQYYGDHGKYPDALEDLVSERYIMDVPKDPFTRSRELWVLIPPTGDVVTGIWNVHSGSDRISLEGEPYNEW